MFLALSISSLPAYASFFLRDTWRLVLGLRWLRCSRSRPCLHPSEIVHRLSATWRREEFILQFLHVSQLQVAKIIVSNIWISRIDTWMAGCILFVFLTLAEFTFMTWWALNLAFGFSRNFSPLKRKLIAFFCVITFLSYVSYTHKFLFLVKAHRDINFTSFILQVEKYPGGFRSNRSKENCKAQI